MEEYSVAPTRRGLRALLSLVPDEAIVIREGLEQTVSPSDLRVGNRMLVKLGSGSLRTESTGRGGRCSTSLRSPG